MRTSVARPFDVIIGSQSKHCTEQSRSGPRPDLNGAADASPRTQTCATQTASSGWQKAPQPFGDLPLLVTDALSWGSMLLSQYKHSRTRVTSKGLNRKDNNVCNE